MKIGMSLEMVNLLTSGPCAFTKQSKKFWLDYFTYISAVGFKGMEVAFNCFSADAMAFETGRSGVPINAGAIANKYGSPEKFLELLADMGIEKITGVHLNANDAMLELVATEAPAADYYGLFDRLCMEGLDHAASLKADGLIISPTPEKGWLKKYFGEDLKDFEEKTKETLKKVQAAAAEKGIVVSVRNEFWGQFSGSNMDALLADVDCLAYTPDLAHLYITGENAVENIKKHADKLAFVHITDTVFEDKHQTAEHVNAELPIFGSQKVFSDCGEGNVDIVGVMKALEEIGYDGWVIFDNRKTLDAYRGLLKLGYYVNRFLPKELGR